MRRTPTAASYCRLGRRSARRLRVHLGIAFNGIELLFVASKPSINTGGCSFTIPSTYLTYGLNKVLTNRGCNCLSKVTLLSNMTHYKEADLKLP
jgi:hypothetical protein